MPHLLQVAVFLRLNRITAILLGLLLTLVGRTMAQPTLTIGTNTRLTGSGPVRLVYGGGTLTNNGALSLPAGQLTGTGPVTYGGTGTATVATALFSHSAGSTTFNSLLSVTSRFTMSANANVNANGQLYLRTDQFPTADLVNNAALSGTVQGLVTNATVNSGTTPYTSQLSTNVSGGAMKYQWQSSADNSAWSDVSGATQSTYTASVNATAYYRCLLTTTNTAYSQTTPAVQLTFTSTATAPVAPTLPNQTATVGTNFNYTVPSFGGTNPVTYGATGLPDGLVFDPATRLISGTPTKVQTPTVTITATNSAGQSSGTFTITVNPQPIQPTGPATLTITSFTCYSTNGALTSVDFTVGYPQGTTGPAVGDLFINGITISGKLGQSYNLGFDANQTSLTVQDQASRSTYFVWNYRQACTSTSVTPPTPTKPMAPQLPDQTATVGTNFSYTVPSFGGTDPVTYGATGLPDGLVFDPTTRLISGTPTKVQTPTVTITATNSAGQSSGTFTIAVSAAPVVVPPTSPAALTITSFTCYSTNGALSGVDFKVTYSDGGVLPAVPDLFINGITISGKLGQTYTLNFDANQSELPIADNATRTVYFVWNYRNACTSTTVTPPAPTKPVAPALPNQTATVGTPFSYVVPAFTGTAPITYGAGNLPDGLVFDPATRTIAGTPTKVQTPTVTITATNGAGQSSGTFTIAVSAQPVPPTQLGSLTITAFTCYYTSQALTSVDFTVGYPQGTTGPAVSDLFINGVTDKGKLNTQYSLSFDANQNSLTVQDQNNRSTTYFTWNYRNACASRQSRLSAEPVAPWQVTVLGNPATGTGVDLQVSRAQGRSLQVRVSDIAGYVVSDQTTPITQDSQLIRAGLSSQAGVYVIQVTDGIRQQSLRVIHP